MSIKKTHKSIGDCMHRCQRSALRVSSTLVPPNNGQRWSVACCQRRWRWRWRRGVHGRRARLDVHSRILPRLGLVLHGTRGGRVGCRAYLACLALSYSYAQADHRGKKCLIGASELSTTHSGLNSPSIASESSAHQGRNANRSVIVHTRRRDTPQHAAARLAPRRLSKKPTNRIERNHSRYQGCLK